ncbi:hypothetical protein UK23_29490 [Lentzea aerocolonigenes]|uniref:Uncharacterized protein n=1 Tax=Lentzea aerocolonigenes TaxID=68170 RepID=A0A0F0GPF5_LENAE|nr:hypothetical protein [Lentzea aerocolonigenes]KJK44436.1 hypothetical protein UK23_29490 [Lentzea aerocolonigenes]
MNEVQVIVSDKYVSRGGFGVAKKEAKELSKEIKDLDSSSKGLGKSLGGLPSIWAGAGSKSGSAFSGSFGKILDGAGGLVAKLPGALNDPRVAGAAAAAGVVAGAAMAGATVTAFGAGLAGLGLKASAGSSSTKVIIDDFKRDMSSGMEQIAKPYEKTWADITNSARREFNNLKPELSAFFRDTAPAVSQFGDDLARSLGKFRPALQPIGSAFKAVLNDLGGRLPGIIEGLADSFGDLARSVEKNPKALGDAVFLMGKLGEVGLGTMEVLNDIYEGAKNNILPASVVRFMDAWGQLDKLEAARDRLDAVGAASEKSTPAMRTVAAAFEEIGDAGDDSAKKASGLLKLMDQLSGQTPDYTQALSSSADAISKIGKEFFDAETKAKGFGSTLLDQAGAFDVTNENGPRALRPGP